MRFVTWTARNICFDKRKECKWTLRADLTDRRASILEKACELDESNPLIKYAAMDRNCTLYAIGVNGQRIDFSSFEEFAAMSLLVENSCQKLRMYYDFLKSKVLPSLTKCKCTSCLTDPTTNATDPEHLI